MTDWFELSEGGDNQFQPVLKAGNGGTILTSEPYISKTPVEKSITSMCSNSLQGGRYKKKMVSNGKFYFNLKATNRQAVDSNQIYATAQSCKAGIAPIKTNDASQTVRDNA